MKTISVTEYLNYESGILHHISDFFPQHVPPKSKFIWENVSKIMDWSKVPRRKTGPYHCF